MSYEQMRDEARLGWLSRIRRVRAFHADHVVSPRREFSGAAAEALLYLGDDIKAVYPELRRLLKQGTSPAQGTAYWVLRQMAAASILGEAAEDKTCRMRGLIIRDLGEVIWSESIEAIPALGRIAGDSTDPLHEEAAVALREIRAACGSDHAAGAAKR